ncbi:hypothetical protein QE250_12025 [Chromatiaceae bacterium AAb-1]|nr:hypothetical protein [Chromatiaceae bacterium AAb-1]
MLAFYQRIASACYPKRLFFWFGLTLAVIAFIYLLLIAPAELGQRWMLSCTLLIICNLLLLLVIRFFNKKLLPLPADSSFWQRIKYRFIWLGYYLLAFITSLLLLAILLLGLRTLLGIIRTLFFS